jgi:hypothetical protein
VKEQVNKSSADALPVERDGGDRREHAFIGEDADGLSWLGNFRIGD